MQPQPAPAPVTNAPDLPTNLSKRHLANIRNAQKSTGPRTAEGKARAACNATKHSLTAQKLVFQTDEFADYFALGLELIEDFRPVGAYEMQVVQKIIDLNWKSNRCSAIETNLHSADLTTATPSSSSDGRAAAVLAQAAGFRKDCETANVYEKLSRMGSRFNRELIRFRRELTEVQAIRLERHGQDTFTPETCRAWLSYKAAHETAVAVQQQEAEETATKQAAQLGETRPAQTQPEPNTTLSEMALFSQTAHHVAAGASGGTKITQSTPTFPNGAQITTRKLQYQYSGPAHATFR